ncbi:protein S100-A1-like [Dendropsophus ebraccatus]|uniref:protein S100-A1-like n=1 Tax=Dendropsophus ebraccatus TaxID=150705 RepID=UPI00383202E3
MNPEKGEMKRSRRLDTGPVYRSCCGGDITAADRCVWFINQNSSKMSSQLEEAMETLISVFHTYSAREGDKHKLSRRELKDLLQNELGEYLETQKDAGTVDKIMKELDENGDGEVDFQEFVILVASLTVACNNFFCESS